MTRPITQHLSADELDLVLEGTIPESVRAHVNACAPCERLVFEERALVRELAHLPLHVPSVGFEDRVMAQVRIADPRQSRAVARVGRRLFATRRSALAAAGLLTALAGSMAASVVWTLGHRDVLATWGSAALDQVLQVTWTALRSLTATAIEQPWYATLRSTLDAPARLAFVAGASAAAWAGGMLALRRVLALPVRRVAHDRP